MTTHGSRLRDVWLVVEAVGRGTSRPARIILWLDEGAVITRRLRRLQRRGLEVRTAAAELRSYKKFWPYLTTEQLEHPLVIIDDDIIYPSTWLSGLMSAHRTNPDMVIAYRAHVVGMLDGSRLSPYSTWVSCDDDRPSFANFATGVSGVLYPPALQRAILAQGDGFLRLAPTADDVWLHRSAVLHGFRTRQALAGQRHWEFIPGSQSSGLSDVNVRGGANDRQLALCHTPLTIGRIAADLTGGDREM